MVSYKIRLKKWLRRKLARDSAEFRDVDVTQRMAKAMFNAVNSHPFASWDSLDKRTKEAWMNLSRAAFPVARAAFRRFYES